MMKVRNVQGKLICRWFIRDVSEGSDYRQEAIPEVSIDS